MKKIIIWEEGGDRIALTEMSTAHIKMVLKECCLNPEMREAMLRELERRCS